MKVKGFVRSRMRESRTYGSARGGYRKVSVYSIVDEDTIPYECSGGEIVTDGIRCKYKFIPQQIL